MGGGGANIYYHGMENFISVSWLQNVSQFWLTPWIRILQKLIFAHFEPFTEFKVSLPFSQEPPLGCILTQFNPARDSATCSCKIRFNIILSFMPGLSGFNLSQYLREYNFAFFYAVLNILNIVNELFHFDDYSVVTCTN